MDHELHEINDAVAIAPFVIVPADQLEEALVEFHAGALVEDGGRLVVDEVAADDLVFGVFQDVLEIRLARAPHRRCDFFVARVLHRTNREIDYGDSWGRNAEGHTGELAFDFGADESDGFRSAGRRRNQIHGCGASAFPILLAGAVDGFLCRGVAVNGGHEAFLNAEPFLEQHVNQRREAVGSAGRVGNDEMFGRIVFVVVDAHDDGDVFVLAWRGDDDALGTCGDVALGLLGVDEQTGGFNDEVNPELFPGESGGILRADHEDVLAVHNDDIVFEFVGGGLLGGDLPLEAALGGIVLQKIRKIVGRDDVAHCHHLNIFAEQALLDDCTKDEAPDASETIDTDFYCHRLLLSCVDPRRSKGRILSLTGEASTMIWGAASN